MRMFCCGVWSSYPKNMEEGKYKRILLLSTGALLSTTSVQQGESIPSIAHAVVIDMNRG